MYNNIILHYTSNNAQRGKTKQEGGFLGKLFGMGGGG